MRDTALNWRLIEGVVTGRLKPPYGLGLRRHPGATNSSDYIGVELLRPAPPALRRGARPARSSRAPGEVRPERAWPAPFQDREIDPDGLERFLVRLARYGKPLYVTENGMADAEDGVRPAFILTHLAALHRAIRKGADVRGYYHWTLVDNYEWAEGWTTRFGLFALDPQTQVRTPRPERPPLRGDRPGQRDHRGPGGALGPRRRPRASLEPSDSAASAPDESGRLHCPRASRRPPSALSGQFGAPPGVPQGVFRPLDTCRSSVQ